MEQAQRDALRQYIADALDIAVIWAYQPSVGQTPPEPPPRPYMAIVPGLDQAVTKVVRGPVNEDGERTNHQLREITLTFRAMADNDWAARDLMRSLEKVLNRGEAILLADTHGIGLMREMGVIGNTQVQDASWVGRAEQDLIFSYPTTDTETNATIGGATFNATFHEPQTEFVTTATTEDP